MSVSLDGILNLNNNAGVEFRSGVVLSAKILETGPNNLVKLFINGKILSAHTSSILKPNQVVHLRVEQHHGIRILKILEISKGFIHTQPTETTAVHPLVSALGRAGLSLGESGENARRKALIDRSHGNPHRLSRLYAEGRSKGLDLPSKALETLDNLLSHSEPDGKRKKEQQRRTWLDAIQENNDTADFLDESMDDLPDLLKLFNKLPGRDGHWLVFPFENGKQGSGLRASLRIRIGNIPTLILSIHRNDTLLEFHLEGISPTRLHLFSDRPKPFPEEKWAKFRRSLSPLGIDVDEKISDIMLSDGFSLMVDHHRYAVDREA